MNCLYASDYGPADPSFNALVDGGRLFRGYEAHTSELARAQNLGQLQAMERQLQRGESIAWCDQGYAWTEGPAVHVFLAGFMIFVALPYAIKRLTPQLWRRLVSLLHRLHKARAVAPKRHALPGGS